MAWLDGGFWPVPITPIDDPGPKPGKRPLGGKDWGKDRPTDEGLRAIYEEYPDAGVGLVLGCEGGVIDLDVDDPEAAALPLARLFPDGLPETRGWRSNDDRYHLLFAFDERLAKYGKRIIKGAFDEKTGKVVGNPHYLGLELRIGTTDPADPSQTQSVIPPSRKADGTPRRWNGHKEILALPESVFEDLDRHAIPKAKEAKPKPAAPAARPAAPAAVPAEKAAPGPEGNGKAPKAAPGRKARSYDRNEVLAAVTGDEGGFLALVEELGVRLTGVVQGEWLECFAVDRDEAKPSAGVNATTGVYHDFGSEESVSLFDLATRIRPGDYPDWRAAVNTLGERFIGVSATPSPSLPTHQEGQGADPSACPDEDLDGLDFDEVNEGPADPHRLARVYVAESHGHAERPTLAHWGSEFARWNGSAWIEWDGGGVKKAVNAAMKREFDRINRKEVAAWRRGTKKDEKGKAIAKPVARQVTTSRVGDVVAALAGEVAIDSAIEQPTWLGGSVPPFPPEEILATRNSLVHYPSLARGEPATAPPSPCYFSPFALAFDFDPTPTPTPAWDGFLASLFGADVDSVRLLQQWFGYILSNSQDYHKALMIVGPKRGGKGTIASVAMELVGKVNVCGPSVAGLAGSFGLEDFIGKRLAVFADARLSNRTDMGLTVDRLLNITAFDALSVARKNRTSWHGRLPTKLMMLSNELLRFREPSGALAGRFLYLKLTNSFFGREDKTLAKRLRTELPGILHWAAKGWADLEQSGAFHEPRSSVDTAREMESLSSPIGQFLAKHAEVGPGFRCPSGDLFDRWEQWQLANHRDFIGDSAWFSQNIKAAVSTVEGPKVLRWEGANTRCFTGVRLRTFEEVNAAEEAEAEANEAEEAEGGSPA